MVAATFLHPVPGVGIEKIFFIGRTILSIVKERGEGISVNEDENDEICSIDEENETESSQLSMRQIVPA